MILVVLSFSGDCMTVKIRLMQKKDLPKLSKIYIDIYNNLQIGEHWTPASAEKMLNYWFERQPDLAFVAVDGKEVVGAVASAIKPWWDGNNLMDGEIFVTPDYQKKGVGKKLMRALFKKALKKYKVTMFDAFTYNKTKFPLSWYKSIGFKENKELAMIYGNVKEILLKLEKE